MTLNLPLPPGARSASRGGIFFRLLFLLFFAMFLFIVYLARYPLLHFAGDFWVVDEAPQTSDAIVMLGIDDYDADAASRAAELFKSGLAPQVVASGRYLRAYASAADLEAHDLTDRGVPASAVVRLSGRAANTREEAIAVGGLITSRGWKRIIVVAPNYHTRRTEYICERVFPAGTVLIVVAAKNPGYDPSQWWRTREGARIFFDESTGMAAAIWELRHNSVRTAPSGMLGMLRRTIGVLLSSRPLRVYS